jgi:hypothetical protein
MGKNVAQSSLHALEVTAILRHGADHNAQRTCTKQHNWTREQPTNDGDKTTPIAMRPLARQTHSRHFVNAAAG